MYEIPDTDDVDPATLSLCVNCAKEPNLKRFVKAHRGGSALCGICFAPHERKNTCDLKWKPKLESLLKALVCFHFDESDYNPHWGGDNPETLLNEENPILEHATTLFHSRSRDWSWVFLEDLFGATPYPERTEGVWIYAGFDDGGMRLMRRAIHRAENHLFGDLRRRLLWENYFKVEPVARQVIDQAGARITRQISAGQTFFRARIGAHRFYKAWEGFAAYKPYEGTDLGAPPAPLASSGRLNRAGVSFLYLASDSNTAASEVRPHPSHLLSLGKFKAKSDLRVAALGVDILDFAESDIDLDIYDFLYTADTAMSMPVLPEDRMGYSITQLIADALRNAGYDGVTFRSSVGSGQNLCVFEPTKMEFVPASAWPIEVNGLAYTLQEARTVPNDAAEDYYAADW